MNPDLAAGVADEETWQSKKIAALNNGVWEVADKVDPNTPGGALYIYIAARDARVIGVYLTQ